jgi:hypothetical protein
MSRKLIGSLVAVAVAAVAVVLALESQDGEAGPVVQVAKSPTCGCCADWVDHLESEGFRVEVEDTGDLISVKRRLGVPGDLSSCHTAVVEGYVIEGHVPAGDIRRLLAERPGDVEGLAVPGMPAGSPGMEGPPPEPYDVVAFYGDGGRRVFASH